MIAEPTTIDVDDVRDELTGPAVGDYFAMDLVRRGRALKLRNGCSCPGCNETITRLSWSMFRGRGGRWMWTHYGRPECRGDMFDLVSRLSGIDRERHFAELKAKCAEIAGVTARPLTAAERDQRRAWRAARDLEERQRDEANAATRREAAQADWDRCIPRHPAGEAYVRSRGLDPGAFIADDLVRYDSRGNICVSIFGFDGRRETVTRRLIAPSGDLKVLVPRGGTQTGTMLRPRQVIDHSRDVVIAEGLMDALTAHQLYPGAVVFGAGGAGQLENVARNVAFRVRRVRTRLILIPDADDIGQHCAAKAIQEARRAGLAPGVDLFVVDIAPHHDLNQAHCAGWAP